jgi:AraC-like DNA-binding protein
MRGHCMERVLPTGSMQMIVNLAHERIADLRPLAGALQRGEALPGVGEPLAASVLVGMQTRYVLIDTAELDEVMGVVFEPGGLRGFVRERADAFRDCDTALMDVLGGAAEALREQLLEARGCAAKMDSMERYLCSLLQAGSGTHAETAQGTVSRFAAERIRRRPSVVSVAALTREVGYSARRFTEVFSREVGLTPKVYARVCRFQQAVQQLHRGAEVPWAELAVACGYYDQSHFANEFHAFSGVSPTGYSAARRVWSNHVPLA